MESQFTVQEKRRWLLKKHIKDHAFEYILDIILTMLFAYLLLKWCKAEDIMLGMVLSFAWGFGRVLQQILYYKKEHINVDIK